MSLSLQTRGKKHSHIPNLSNLEIIYMEEYGNYVKSTLYNDECTAYNARTTAYNDYNGERTAYNGESSQSTTYNARTTA